MYITRGDIDITIFFDAKRHPRISCIVPLQLYHGLCDGLCHVVLT